MHSFLILLHILTDQIKHVRVECYEYLHLNIEVKRQEDYCNKKAIINRKYYSPE